MTGVASVKCPDCETENVHDIGLLNISDTFAGIKVEPLVSRLYGCDSCHLGFRAPRFASNKILDLYASAKLNVWKQIEPPEPWKVIYLSLKKIAPKTILDFGCFAGDFLHKMPIQCKKFGIEPSLEGGNEARRQGIEILGRTALDLSENIKFDVITLLDVIEHVEKPSVLMCALAAQLNPGGRLFVLTGAYDSFWFRLLAPRFWYCSIGEHLVFISKKWSIRFADSHGLQLINYDLIAYEPKSKSKTLVEVARALAFSIVVPILMRIPKIAKIFGMGRFLLWKNAPTVMSCKDHVIAVFQKK